MCLYPRQYINKKYTATDKNGGNIPELPVVGRDSDGNKVYDQRVLSTMIPCGHCIECCTEKANHWRIRMIEEIKTHKYNYFITLTFSNEELKKILEEHNYKCECNAAAGVAVRRHLERWRKDNRCQLKHWYITELGHENTERIHIHGILFSDQDLSGQFERIVREHDGWRCNWKYWKYGHIWVGDYCSEKTINYIVKYMTKIDTDHKGFYGQILCSPGIGRSYTEKIIFNTYRYIKGQTKNYYRLNNGTKVGLPTYYNNKAYNEEERELKWRDSMDKDETTIMKQTYKNKFTDQRTLGRITQKAQELNSELGYGSDSDEWKKKEYNITERMLRKAEKKEQIREEYERWHESTLLKITEKRKKLQEKFGSM